jgi:hypothetical protein
MREYTILKCGCRPGLHEVCNKCMTVEQKDPKAMILFWIFCAFVWGYGVFVLIRNVYEFVKKYTN